MRPHLHLPRLQLLSKCLYFTSFLAVIFAGACNTLLLPHRLSVISQVFVLLNTNFHEQWLKSYPRRNLVWVLFLRFISSVPTSLAVGNESMSSNVIYNPTEEKN